jgi:hypothetical protein
MLILIVFVQENFEDSFLTKEQRKAINAVSKGAHEALLSGAKRAMKPATIAKDVKNFTKLLSGNLGRNMQPIYGRLKLEAEVSRSRYTQREREREY